MPETREDHGGVTQDQQQLADGITTNARELMAECQE